MKHLIRRTKRLIVRPLKISDYKVWKIGLTTMHPAKNRWDQGNWPDKEVTLTKFKKILKSQKENRNEDRFYSLAVFEKASGQHVGSVSIMDVNRGLGQSAFLGYFINNRFWGKGYGKEATQAGIDIGFRDLKLHRLEAGVEPANRRSILLARSLGLRKEGLKKRAVFIRGQWQDLVVYCATCEEFGIKWRGIARRSSR
jgi:[ribosomal protein S5]-alanine N-acetyltransferase